MGVTNGRYSAAIRAAVAAMRPAAPPKAAARSSSFPMRLLLSIAKTHSILLETFSGISPSFAALSVALRNSLDIYSTR